MYKGQTMITSGNENFDATCDLFCKLVKTLEDGGNDDIAEIIDRLMQVWLSKTLKG